MKNETNWQSVGLGLVSIALLGLIIFALFHEIGQAPWQFITILIALVGTLITFAGNFQIQIRNEQRPKKVEIYDRVIKFFFDSIYANKLGQQPKIEEELVQGFYEITPDLILWASDDVLALYIKFRQITVHDGQVSSDSPILLFGKMMISRLMGVVVVGVPLVSVEESLITTTKQADLLLAVGLNTLGLDHADRLPSAMPQPRSLLAHTPSVGDRAW